MNNKVIACLTFKAERDLTFYVVKIKLLEPINGTVTLRHGHSSGTKQKLLYTLKGIKTMTLSGPYWDKSEA